EIIAAGLRIVDRAEPADTVDEAFERCERFVSAKHDRFQRIDDHRRLENGSIDLLPDTAVCTDEADLGQMVEATRAAVNPESDRFRKRIKAFLVRGKEFPIGQIDATRACEKAKPGGRIIPRIEADRDDVEAVLAQSLARGFTGWIKAFDQGWADVGASGIDQADEQWFPSIIGQLDRAALGIRECEIG